MNGQNNTILEFCHVDFGFQRGKQQLFKNLDFKIKSGEFVSVLGPSGCGKSTVLRLAAGLILPDQGQVLCSSLIKKKLGFVFQEPELMPWRTVKQNISLSFELKEMHCDAAKIEEVIDLVRLTPYAHFYPRQLSGGMKMRVSLARALVDPGVDFLLMDEPFSALDELIRNELQQELKVMVQQRGISVLFVTHSVMESVYLSDRIVIMDKTGRFCHDVQVPNRALQNQSWRESADYYQLTNLISHELRSFNSYEKL